MEAGVGGVVVLPPLAKTPWWTVPSYGEALDLLVRQQQALGTTRVGWLRSPGAAVQVAAPVLGARGLDLNRCVFFETWNLGVAFQGAAALGGFDALVVEGPSKAHLRQRARVWVRGHGSGLLPATDLLQSFPKRLVVFLEPGHVCQTRTPRSSPE